VTATAMQPEITWQGPKRTEDTTIEDIKKGLASVDATVAPKGIEGTTLDDAKGFMDKTKNERKDLARKNPVFADIVRVDRPLFFHPGNPTRKWLEGKTGPCHLEYVAFSVKSKDSDGKPHTWPLRLVRFKYGEVDSGWKVLPASTWDPE